MNRKRLTIIDQMALSRLERQTAFLGTETPPSPNQWIRILRTYLRMTQMELAERAKITQSHVAGIESGKTDPQIGTLRKIFRALSCDLAVSPISSKPLEEILRGRARSIALKRLKQSMGTMAMEGQAPEPDVFRELLEKRTDEILSDPRERLWNKTDE